MLGPTPTTVAVSAGWRSLSDHKPSITSNQVGADGGRGGAPDSVESPANLSSFPAPMRSPLAGTNPTLHSGPRRARRPLLRRHAENPVGRAAGQEDHRQGKDEYEPGEDEAHPPEEGSGGPAQPPGAEDSQLGRGGTRQEVGGGDGVFELLGTDPSPLFHAQAPQQGNVGRGPAEPDAAEAKPLRAMVGKATRGAERPVVSLGLAWSLIRLHLVSRGTPLKPSRHLCRIHRRQS